MERFKRQLELPNGKQVPYEIAKEPISLDSSRSHYYTVSYDDKIIGHVKSSNISNGTKYNPRPFDYYDYDEIGYRNVPVRNFQNQKTCVEYLVLLHLANG